jgi:hypothetical protein
LKLLRLLPFNGLHGVRSQKTAIQVVIRPCDISISRKVIFKHSGLFDAVLKDEWLQRIRKAYDLQIFEKYRKNDTASTSQKN